MRRTPATPYLATSARRPPMIFGEALSPSIRMASVALLSDIVQLLHFAGLRRGFGAGRPGNRLLSRCSCHITDSRRNERRLALLEGGVEIGRNGLRAVEMLGWIPRCCLDGHPLDPSSRCRAINWHDGLEILADRG